MKKMLIFSLGVTTGLLISKKMDAKKDDSNESQNLMTQMNNLYQTITDMNNDSLKDRALNILDMLKNELIKPVKTVKSAVKSKKLKARNSE